MAEKRDDKQQQQPAARPAIPDNATVAQLRAALAGVQEPPTVGAVQTEPEDPAEHFFLNTAGKKVNAFGEEKGSKEDRQRMAALGFAQPA